MCSMRRIGYTRPRATAKAQEIKGVVWFGLFFFALLAYAIWSSAYIFSTRQSVAIGLAVDCIERPSFDYFAFCNANVDGPACTLASQSRMMQFYEPIDYACAQFEPQRAFVFKVYNPDTDQQEIASIEN